MIRMTLALAGAAMIAACADTPEPKAASTTDAPAAAAPSATGPAAADTSAQSPMTVNPPAGAAVPETPPTLPKDDAADDTSMPPGPVNPKP